MATVWVLLPVVFLHCLLVWPFKSPRK